MKSVFILYQTDAWNSRPDFLGVYSTKKKAIKGASAHSGNRITIDDAESLRDINQTQGRETNYQINEEEVL